MRKNVVIRRPRRIRATFHLDDGSTVTRKVISLDSLPKHNARGLRPAVSKEEMIQLVLDEFERELRDVGSDTLVDLTNRVVMRMNIVPTFTYREIGDAVAADSRFSHYLQQVISLAGRDPIEGLVDRLDSPESD